MGQEKKIKDFKFLCLKNVVLLFGLNVSNKKIILFISI